MSLWRNRAAWILVFLGALGFYLFENNTGTRILLLAAALLPLCSALALYLPGYEITAALDQLPKTLNRDQEARGRLLLKNQGSFPVFHAESRLEIRNVLTGERVALSVPGDISGKDSVSAGFAIRPGHYGKIVVTVAETRLFDLLGLFSRRVDAFAEAEAFAAPPDYPLTVTLAETVDQLQDSLRYSTRKPGYDPSETFRIREYAPGDPIRQIHWKLSEKSDQLLVRDFGLPVVDRLLILLENTRWEGASFSPETMDELLELLFSLSRELLEKGVAHTVGWQQHPEGGYAGLEVSGWEQLPVLRERVLSAPMGAGGLTVAGCYDQSHGASGYAHVAVLAPAPVPDIDVLCRGSRLVTQLLPGSGNQTAGLSNWEGGSTLSLYRVKDLAGGTLHLEL